MPLDPSVHVLVQPDYDTGPVLEVPEDDTSGAAGTKGDAGAVGAEGGAGTEGDTVAGALPEDEVDGLDHDLLDLLAAAVRHLHSILAGLCNVRVACMSTLATI